MKARSTAIQGALALVGLLAAFLTWQRPPQTAARDAVTVVAATRQSLERVRYEDGTRAVELEKQDRLLVALSYLPGKRPVVDAGVALEALDAGVDGGVQAVAVKPPEPPPDRVLYANERAESVWSKLAPLEASRALGVLPREKLEELGLEGSERRLALTVAGVTRRFVVSRPQSGLIGHYARDEQSGEVFLLASSLFTDLDPSSQVLVDRRLHAFKALDFDAFTVKAEGKEAAFVHRGDEVPQKTAVARAARPEVPDELARNWHEKLWSRLVVTEVLGRDEAPKHGAPAVQVRLDYAARGKALGFLELGLDPSGGTWARTENTIGWVAVHQGSEELMLEARRIVAN